MTALRILVSSLLTTVMITAYGSSEDKLKEAIQKANQTQTSNRLTQGLELDASVVIDTYLFHADSDEGYSHVLEEVSGFGHTHGDHDHDHGEIENGFNLRHIELGLSADVDPYFSAWSILAISEGSAEVEEAFIQSSSLPAGLTVAAGKFFSGFGRSNWKHSHDWDFRDQALVYTLLMGDHGLNEKGMQLTWLAPTNSHLLFGVEAFNGENETLFANVDAEELPEKDGPRAWTGWVKVGPNLGDRHGLQMGLSAASGYHQEAHDGNDDGTNDHWLHGRTTLLGADLVYKYDAIGAHGVGDILVQAEYLYRRKMLEVKQHDLNAAMEGRNKEEEQDGYYVQALYGVAPRWRVGLRWDEVGLKNINHMPDGASESFNPSQRLSGCVDWRLSEFSLIRFQAGRGEYKTEDGEEKNWEFSMQLQVTFGKHAAHNF